MTRDDVRAVQRLLRALGRDVAIDGIITSLASGGGAAGNSGYPSGEVW